MAIGPPIAFPQTSYPLNMAAALPGQVEGGFQQGRDAISVLLESTSDWGLAVSNGSIWGRGITPAQAGDLADGAFLGFAIMQALKEPRSPRFAVQDAIAVLRKGRIWIQVAQDVASGVRPYIVYSGSTAGQIRADNTNAAQAAGVRVLQGATNGNLALVEVNLAI